MSTKHVFQGLVSWSSRSVLMHGLWIKVTNSKVKDYMGQG